MVKLEPLSSVDIQAISGAVIDLAKAAERIMHASLGHEFSEGSKAAAWEADRLNRINLWRGTPPVTAALRSVAFTELAALDHMRTFAAGLRARTPATVSLATLARGALEAFARANYIMRGASARELLKRHGSVEIADLEYTLKYEHEENSPALHQWADGKPIGPNELKQQILDDMKATGISVASVPRRTELVRQLLDSALSRAGGHVRYSTVSAVAHGESYAVNAFITEKPVEGAGVVGTALQFQTPRDFAIDYGVFVMASCAYLQDKLVEVCSPLHLEVERWSQVRARALGVIQQLAVSRDG